MDINTSPILRALSVGVPLFLLGDGLLKGTFRLQGPGRNHAGGGYVRRSERPVAFWSIALLLLLASGAMAWFLFSFLGE